MATGQLPPPTIDIPVQPTLLGNRQAVFASCVSDAALIELIQSIGP